MGELVLMPSVANNRGEAPLPHGILDFDGLVQRSAEKPPYTVSGLIPERSITVLAGNSGLGKTPLATTGGVAIASVTPFLGLSTKPGKVLYCNGEGHIEATRDLIESVSRTAGLSRPPGREVFQLWSPSWDTQTNDAPSMDAIEKRVRAVSPTFVVVDTLRVFAPDAEEKAAYASLAIQHMRELTKEVGCSWLLIHHLRKPVRDGSQVRLQDSPREWFNEVAGSNAVITQTDVRLGLEPAHKVANAELVLGGYVRGIGCIEPIYLGRLYGEGTELPLGFTVISGKQTLSPRFQDVFQRLPDPFRFSDVQRELGTAGGSSPDNAIKAFIKAGVARKDAQAKLYCKVDGVH